MKGFDHILNWKLLSGSHEFPSKGGGTSINKAAVVAGFKYQRAAELLFTSDLPLRNVVEG
jgi:hypothetical protein